MPIYIKEIERVEVIKEVEVIRPEIKIVERIVEVPVIKNVVERVEI